MSASARYPSTVRRDPSDATRVRSRSFRSSLSDSKITTGSGNSPPPMPVRGRPLQHAVANLQSILSRATAESILEEEEQESRDSVTLAEQRGRTVLRNRISGELADVIAKRAQEERLKANGIQRRKLQEVEFKARAHIRRQRDVEMGNIASLEKSRRPSPPLSSPMRPMIAVVAPKQTLEAPTIQVPVRSDFPPFLSPDDEDQQPSFLSDHTAAPNSGQGSQVFAPEDDDDPIASRRLSPTKEHVRSSEYPYPIPPRRRNELGENHAAKPTRKENPLVSSWSSEPDALRFGPTNLTSSATSPSHMEAAPTHRSPKDEQQPSLSQTSSPRPPPTPAPDFPGPSVQQQQPQVSTANQQRHSLRPAAPNPHQPEPAEVMAASTSHPALMQPIVSVIPTQQQPTGTAAHAPRAEAPVDGSQSNLYRDRPNAIDARPTQQQQQPPREGRQRPPSEAHHQELHAAQFQTHEPSVEEYEVRPAPSQGAHQQQVTQPSAAGFAQPRPHPASAQQQQHHPQTGNANRQRPPAQLPAPPSNQYHPESTQPAVQDLGAFTTQQRAEAPVDGSQSNLYRDRPNAIDARPTQKPPTPVQQAPAVARSRPHPLQVAETNLRRPSLASPINAERPSPAADSQVITPRDVMNRERSFTTIDSPTTFPNHVLRDLHPNDIVSLEASADPKRPPQKGVLAVRFSSHVVKRRQVGLVQVPVDSSGAVVQKGDSLLGRMSGAWGSEGKGSAVATVDAISIGAATLGQRMRGVPTEVIPLRDVCVMVHRIEFNDPDAQELILDEDGNSVMRGCPFYLVRKDDGAMVEMVCNNNAERLQWLAWLRAVTGEQVVIASEVAQALEVANTPPRADPTSRPLSPVRAQLPSGNGQQTTTNISTMPISQPRGNSSTKEVEQTLQSQQQAPARLRARSPPTRSPPKSVPTTNPPSPAEENNLAPTAGNEERTAALQRELERAQLEIAALKEAKLAQERQLMKQELLAEIRHEEEERRRREREEDNHKALQTLAGEHKLRDRDLNHSIIRKSTPTADRTHSGDADMLSPTSMRILDALENTGSLDQDSVALCSPQEGVESVPMPFDVRLERQLSRSNLKSSSRYSSPDRFSSSSRRSSRLTSPVKDMYGNLYHTDEYGNRVPYVGRTSFHSRPTSPVRVNAHNHSLHSSGVYVPHTIHSGIHHRPVSPHHNSSSYSSLPPRTSAFEHYQSELSAAAASRRRLFMNPTPYPRPTVPLRVVFDDLCLMYHPSLTAMNHSIYGRLVLVQGGPDILMSPSDPLGQLKHTRQVKPNVDLMLPVASIKGFSVESDHEVSIFLRTSSSEVHSDPNSDGVVWRVTGNDDFSNMLYCCQLLGERIGVTVMNPRALHDLAAALS